MSALAKYFKKKKLDNAFNKLGTGRSLNEPSKIYAEEPTKSTSPSACCRTTTDASSKSAEAALSRLNAKNEPPKPSVSKVDNQIRKAGEQLKEAEEQAARFAVKERHLNKPLIINDVFFCRPDILGENVHGLYSEINDAIQRALIDEAVRSPSEASTLLLIRGIETSPLPPGYDPKDEKALGANAIRDKRRQNFVKILKNIIENPENEAYRRLRASNKLISDLLVIDHARDFLKACGFVETKLPAPKAQNQTEDDHEEILEDYFLLKHSGEQLGHLEVMLNLLETAEPITPQVYRDTTVLKATGAATHAVTRDELPDEFFSISRGELRRMAEQQQKAVEESGMLLTKAMRERLRIKERLLYRFILIRVRIPGEFILQGVFHASEALGAVRSWIVSCLVNQAICFRLWAPPGTPGLGQSLTARVALDDNSMSLVDLGLAPCSLLIFSFDETLTAPGTELLRPELLEKVQTFST